MVLTDALTGARLSHWHPGDAALGGTTGAQPAQQPHSGVAPAFDERPVVANGRITPAAPGSTDLAGALAATGSSTGLLLNLAVALMMAGIVVLLGARRRTA